MGRYRVYFRESVEKDLRALPEEDVMRILDRVSLLGAQPRPPGCEKLTDQEGYRVRQGRYRIVYSVPDAEHSVWVANVAHRKDVYR